jgi:hypothetical protein
MFKRVYMIDIQILTSIDKETYHSFLLTNPKSLIYLSLEFHDFLKAIVPGKPYYITAFNNGIIEGVLPFFRAERAGFGAIINSLPWYGSYGGCMLSAETGSAVREALLKKYLSEVSSKDVIVSTMILSPFETNIEQCLDILQPPFTEERIGQITYLPEDGPDLEERLLSVLRQKTRNLVRKSIKQGFSLAVTDETWAWEFLYETHRENMHAIGGKAKPVSHFHSFRENIPPDQQELLVATSNNRPVAAVLVCFFNKTTEYITPVIKNEYRPQQPLSFLIWHSMLRSVKKGHKYWNWGGTWRSQKSLHHFKSGFGAVDFPYSYMIHASAQSISRIKNIIDEMHDAFPYYFIFPYDKL